MSDSFLGFPFSFHFQKLLFIGIRNRASVLPILQNGSGLENSVRPSMLAFLCLIVELWDLHLLFFLFYSEISINVFGDQPVIDFMENFSSALQNKCYSHYYTTLCSFIQFNKSPSSPSNVQMFELWDVNKNVNILPYALLSYR